LLFRANRLSDEAKLFGAGAVSDGVTAPSTVKHQRLVQLGKEMQAAAGEISDARILRSSLISQIQSRNHEAKEDCRKDGPDDKSDDCAKTYQSTESKNDENQKNVQNTAPSVIVRPGEACSSGWALR